MTSIKPRIWIMAGTGLVAASLLAWWWQNRAPADAMAAAAGGRAPAASASAAAPGGAGPGSGAPVAVEVARAEARDLTEDTTAVGSLRAHQAVSVRPEVAGRIVKLGFGDGERVRRGQLLVQMDDALAQAQLAQAAAQLEIAMTTLRRNQDLVAQNFVTQSVVDQAQATVKVAEAQVALMRATAARLRILAPFDGQTGIRAVNVGDVVKDGADIVSLQDASSVFVDFSLPERYAPRLRVKQRVAVSFDALPKQDFTAVVEALEPQISADGRAILARARIANADGVLRAGMFARVRVVLAQRSAAVLVPEEAVVPLAGKELLIKVNESEQGLRSQRVEIKTGLRREGRVEVLGGGVVAGDRVVTAGQSRLLRADGQTLRVVEVGRTTPGPSPSSPSAPGTTGPAKSATAVPPPVAAPQAASAARAS